MQDLSLVSAYGTPLLWADFLKLTENAEKSAREQYWYRYHY